MSGANGSDFDIWRRRWVSNPDAPKGPPVSSGLPLGRNSAYVSALERRVAVETTNAGVAVPPLLHFAFRRMVRPLGFEPRCPKATVLRLPREPFRQGRKTWWAWRDSNSHVRRRQFLRLVCMQFHHRPMALRGRFEQPIVGLEATCVTIRIRSTLVGRAGFEPTTLSRRVTGATAQRFQPLTHLPDVKELTCNSAGPEDWE